MMAETIQRSIFDFQDRILPKVVKTITGRKVQVWEAIA